MRTLLCSIVVLLAPLLHAQEGRPVRCRFLSFGGTGPDITAVATSDKGAPIHCPLSSSQLSGQIVCQTRGDTIPFVSSTDRKPLATATIPAGVGAALLIFVQAPKKPDAAADAPSWRVMVIEDSPKNFPDGGAFVANFYSKDIRFVIGEHKGMLRAAGSFGYAMPKERDDFNMSPVIFEFLQEDKWRIANESSLRFLPGMRYLIFAYVDPVSGRPRINTYQDFAPPAIPAAKRG
ncbi:MAG: hypothetical protein V4584_10565 [Verrucomicrobiota bacterium]